MGTFATTYEVTSITGKPAASVIDIPSSSRLASILKPIERLYVRDGPCFGTFFN